MRFLEKRKKMNLCQQLQGFVDAALGAHAIVYMNTKRLTSLQCVYNHNLKQVEIYTRYNVDDKPIFLTDNGASLVQTKCKWETITVPLTGTGSAVLEQTENTLKISADNSTRKVLEFEIKQKQ